MKSDRMSNEERLIGQSFEDALRSYIDLINQALDQAVPSSDALPMAIINDAMRYSLLSGGKRIRALLPLMIVASYGQDPQLAMASACALEMIHTYSLIHDDLPCMDDDDFRRGRPTNHKTYGEAMALLAGDALLTAAFGRLQRGCLEGDFSAATLVHLLGILADASGTAGMVGGQVLDMKGLSADAGLTDLQQIHRLKTGALLKAAVLMGATTAGASDADLDHWYRFGDALGLAFQIQDDILDLIGDEHKMGKKAGRDAKNNKVTYVTLLGLDGARAALCSEHQRMLTALAALPIDGDHLKQLVTRLMERES